LDIKMREAIKEALIKHAEGHIAKHKANVEVYLKQPVGIGEHSDILESIEKELAIIAQYDDEIEVLNKYF
tara:strand:- start:1931 stop:2140 length:210 start_codon:yes stop_codon:yes gene_type:complete